MACRFFCDNCGKGELSKQPNVYHIMPDGWASASAEDGQERHACSAACQRAGLNWKVPLRYNKPKKTKKRVASKPISHVPAPALPVCELCQALGKLCYAHEPKATSAI